MDLEAVNLMEWPQIPVSKAAISCQQIEHFQRRNGVLSPALSVKGWDVGAADSSKPGSVPLTDLLGNLPPLFHPLLSVHAPSVLPGWNISMKNPGNLVVSYSGPGQKSRVVFSAGEANLGLCNLYFWYLFQNSCISSVSFFFYVSSWKREQEPTLN